MKTIKGERLLEFWNNSQKEIKQIKLVYDDGTFNIYPKFKIDSNKIYEVLDYWPYVKNRLWHTEYEIKEIKQ